MDYKKEIKMLEKEIKKKLKSGDNGGVNAMMKRLTKLKRYSKRSK